MQWNLCFQLHHLCFMANLMDVFCIFINVPEDEERDAVSLCFFEKYPLLQSLGKQMNSN